ncbi:MAG: GNAT family N-acetyltransferase, partial [Cyanobacteria bacterium P01_D01_bin.14]
MVASLDAFVELDRLNMAPIIEAAGGKFDPVFRRTRLIAEIESGSELIAVWRNDSLAAYLEFQIINDRCKVQSIQIHPDHQGSAILACLLGKVCKMLQDAPRLIVHSSVHEGNTKSLSLHQKLGFREIKRERNRVMFEVHGYDLIKHLSRFERRVTYHNPGAADG